MNQSDLHVIIGSGPVGLAVMRELMRQGRRIRIINRSGVCKEKPASVELFAADVYDIRQAKAAAEGAAVIYQCAQPAYGQWTQQFQPLQANIIDAAAAAQAKLIVADNLYMYGEANEPLHEGLPYAARTRKGQLRAVMAEAVMAAHSEGRIRAALVRSSDFYGPHVLGSSMGERVFSPMLKGKPAAAIGNIDLPHTYTYIDDFGRAMVNVGDTEHALGQIWHAPSAETVTTRSFLSAAFEQLGQKPRINSMGRTMMRIGGIFIPEAREVIEMMYQFEKPFIVNNSKYSAAFQHQPIPIRQAIAETLEWYRLAFPQYVLNKLTI